MTEMFDMGSNAESWTAADLDQSKWDQADHADASTAKEFLQDLKDTYDPKELGNLAGMVATQVDDNGKGLGDSRLFIKAIARAARRVDSIIQAREGTNGPEGRRLKFNMPMSEGQRRSLAKDAQGILEAELMQARAEFIRRSGRPLPGWVTGHLQK